MSFWGHCLFSSSFVFLPLKSSEFLIIIIIIFFLFFFFFVFFCLFILPAPFSFLIHLTRDILSIIASCVFCKACMEPQIQRSPLRIEHFEGWQGVRKSGNSTRPKVRDFPGKLFEAASRIHALSASIACRQRSCLKMPVTIPEVGIKYIYTYTRSFFENYLLARTSHTYSLILSNQKSTSPT